MTKKKGEEATSGYKDTPIWEEGEWSREDWIPREEGLSCKEERGCQKSIVLSRGNWGEAGRVRAEEEVCGD